MHSESVKWVGNEEVLDKETGRYRKVEYGDIVFCFVRRQDGRNRSVRC